MYHFRNLVFEGGGVKGIAYVGALEVLEEKGILAGIKRIGGTSAGAINAVLYGLGYASHEVKAKLLELDFMNFCDSSWGVVGDIGRLVTKYGWYKGDYFHTWIGNFIAEKAGNPNATFLDLKSQGFREIYLIGANVSTGFSQVFSVEHTPDMSVVDAVRISMSIPFFFTARKSGSDTFVDGGIFDNYPVKLFDRAGYVEKNALTTEYYQKYNQSKLQAKEQSNPYVYNQETLGFRLSSGEGYDVFSHGGELPRKKITNLFNFARAVVGAMLNQQENSHLHSDDWQRTIYIDTLGVKFTDFQIERSVKEALIQSGRMHTEKYFTWFDDPNSVAANKARG